MPIQIAPGRILDKPTIAPTGISPTTGSQGILDNAGNGLYPPQGTTQGSTITIVGTNLDVIYWVILFGRTTGGQTSQIAFAAIPVDTTLNVNTGSLYHWGVITRVSPTQIRFTIPCPAPGRGLASVVTGKLQVAGPNGLSNLSAQSLLINNPT